MPRMIVVRAILLSLLIVCSAQAAPTPEQELEIFEERVRPLLAKHCFECHGAKKEFAGLRLDTHSRILAGGESGAAIVPGKPEESLLVEAIRRESFEMPPEEELTEEEIAVLVEWIRRGAFWPEEVNQDEMDRQQGIDEHWSFQPITDPPLPEVKQSGWPKNPIDHFILARLESEGLSPSPPASRRTLLRRMAWNLTGLPVEAEKANAFLKSETQQSFADLANELLDSPHYGERWGRYWLDLARYADTRGYCFFEQKPFVWGYAYRDYVINSFNADKPFDQFVREQLAADLLPDAEQNPASLAALGFVTIGARFKNSIPDILDDRIDVVMRGMMGLTVTCARCHDHKYDPISTEDYYSLYGIFANSVEPFHQPFLQHAELSPEAKQKADELVKLATDLEAFRIEQYEKILESSRTRLAEYLRSAQAKRSGPETENFDTIVDGDDIFPRMVRHWQQYLTDTEASEDPVFAAWHRLAKVPAGEFASKCTEVIHALVEEQKTNLLVIRALVQPPPSSFEEVINRYAKLLSEIDREWQQRVEQAEHSQDEPPSGFADPDKESLRLVLSGKYSPLKIPIEQYTNLHLFPDRKSQGVLKPHYENLHKAKTQAPAELAQAIALHDAPTLVEARVFKRGNPARPGQVVPRRFLTHFSRVTDETFENGSGRRQLAEAIVDPVNPLTARVIANRVWQHHFGQGLVVTPSNFGLQGASPSHPQLLDHLATWLIEHDWSIKALHRYILASATYQQQSNSRSECEEIDPGNRFCWKMNRRRQDWEAMRDALLWTADRLDDTIGGPSVKAGMANDANRRTLYSYLDRNDFPGVFRMFDFPSPDVSSGARNRTTVPGQSLFLMNHPLIFACAKSVTEDTENSESQNARVHQLFERILQRSPTDTELADSLEFVRVTPPVEKQDRSWTYGYGTFDDSQQKLTQFQMLPHWTGKQWQGGSKWPDSKLGWVALNPNGGHPGNDMQHVAVARWTAPSTMKITCAGVLEHDRPQGNGITGRIIHNGSRIAGPWQVHQRQVETKLEEFHVEAGDTLDFVVDINGNLGYDSYTWIPKITLTDSNINNSNSAWDYHQDFHGNEAAQLTPWQRLAQVLLLTNEFQFID